MKNYDVSEIRNWITSLKAGDEILLSGTVYTARDAAHKRLFSMYENGEELPIDIKDKLFYYCGPIVDLKNGSILSAGPTTSGRMDRYVPFLMEKYGLAGTIGKGMRSKTVIDAIKRNKGVYFCAYGGLGALLADRIIECRTIAFPELGCESIKEMKLKEFPVTVGIDSNGNSIL